MSYDLIMWSAVQPVRRPTMLWSTLYYTAMQGVAPASQLEHARSQPMLPSDEALAMVTPLTTATILAAFRKEFRDDLVVEPDGDKTRIEGRGWSLSMRDGATYLHVTCSWKLPEEPERLSHLRRAALRAGCSTYDPQTEEYFEPV